MNDNILLLFMTIAKRIYELKCWRDEINKELPNGNHEGVNALTQKLTKVLLTHFNSQLIRYIGKLNDENLPEWLKNKTSINN